MLKYYFNKVANRFIEITLRHGCFLVSLLHAFKTHFPKDTSLWLSLFSLNGFLMVLNPQ